MRRVLAACCAAMLLSGPAGADDFRRISERGAFLDLVEGRALTRFGIRLDVLGSGRIEGRAFGRDVTGVWNWQQGYFCRDLSFGRRALGPNCQVVKIDGDTLRFIADQGAGDQADLTLR